MYRKTVLAALPALLLAGALLQGTGCKEITGLGGCEVIYVVQQSDSRPETGIRFHNDLSTGLDLIVSGRNIVDAGADMAPGACEIYGLFAGTYTVRMRQCEQNERGSSRCTSTYGPEVRRTVTVEQGRITEFRVNRSFFP